MIPLEKVKARVLYLQMNYLDLNRVQKNTWRRFCNMHFSFI
jgi:hypothetical protein